MRSNSWKDSEGAMIPNAAYLLLAEGTLQGVEGQARQLYQDWEDVTLHAVAPRDMCPFLVRGRKSMIEFPFFRLKKEKTQ